MADLNVDTTSAGYQQRLQQFRDIRGYYAPKIRKYMRLSGTQKKAWRQRDPLLRDLLDFARKVHMAKDDVT